MQEEHTMKQITVIGLGIIGSIWARHYISDGYAVRVWNRTPKPDFPGWEEDLAKAVESSEVVHICVADPPAVAAVLQKILPALPVGTLVIQSSTISPEASKFFSEQCRQEGFAYVEAPFTGSKPAAEARQVVFFLGGEKKTRGQAEGVLQGLAKKFFHFSSGEKSAAIKLAMNLQIAAISQALTEGLSLARQYGLGEGEFFPVLEANVAHSGLADLKRPKLEARDYTPQFSVKHMGKDLGLALEAIKEGELPQLRRTWEIYQKGLQKGLGDMDFIALEQLLTDKTKFQPLSE
ncbi:MAG: NAD(P)-dependent oxidoreductase [Opitutales bacterium]|nr:NAD(P)-dependent oxidoreductase [Opitutales bacterium]